VSIVRAIARTVFTSLSQGRAILGQIHRPGLEDIGADAELDIVQPGTALSEFYRLSIAATSEPLISAGVLTAAEAARLMARLDEPDFMAYGFAFIGAWTSQRRLAHPKLSAPSGSPDDKMQQRRRQNWMICVPGPSCSARLLAARIRRYARIATK
jgi:hypothetical protein